MAWDNKPMKASYILKNLVLVERNKEWLRSRIPVREKIAYYPAFFSSYARLLVGGDKHIRYFGHRFYYDNPATPFNLQTYPFEITHKVLRHMKIVPKHVIDIGGNIGQFPLTMAAILPDVSVDALEPNSDIYKILKKNVKPYKNVHVYNVGVGKATQEATMFYQPAHSCTGSLLAENAGDAETLKEIPITLVDDIPKLTKRSQYDLATIDVEGYEMDVLKSLKGLKTRYLFIEVSSQGRAKTYLHSRLFDTIREMFGAFDIVYSLGQSAGAAAFDVLLEFPETPSPTLG